VSHKKVCRRLILIGYTGAAVFKKDFRGDNVKQRLNLQGENFRVQENRNINEEFYKTKSLDML
jgi:hypothetical protein